MSIVDANPFIVTHAIPLYRLSLMYNSLQCYHFLYDNQSQSILLR